MITYVIRRLLLMIPTLIGITLMVFLIVAAAPGGIGAALRIGGGEMDATGAAEQQAYLEDRYGLDQPLLVQYGNWFMRILPIKFGTRDLVDPRGEYISFPREIEEPTLWELFLDDLPEAPQPEFDGLPGLSDLQGPQTQEALRDAHTQIFRRAKQAYVRDRIAFVGARAVFEQELATYLLDNGMDRAVRASDQSLRLDRLADFRVPADDPAWGPVQEAADRMFRNHEQALASFAEYAEVFKARPFPQAGFGTDWISIGLPDLGVSYSRKRPVIDLIADALPVTLLLNLIAFPIIYFVSIPSGLLAAVRRGTWVDTGSGALFVALWSFPVVLAGVLFGIFLADDQYLGWFPTSHLNSPGAEQMLYLPAFTEDGFRPGYLLDMVWHIVGPVLCLVYTGFAVLSKQTRAAMLDNFNADYVRTAKAKGVANRDVIFRHVLRNSLLPLITMAVSIFPAMLSGSVVIEKIFSIEGMGKLALDAINLRDREIILATTLMIGAINLLALLLADVLYAVADPRISYD